MATASPTRLLLAFALAGLLTHVYPVAGAFSYYEIHCRRKPWKWNTNATVPKDGIYVFSLRADPLGWNKDQMFDLEINGNNVFSAIAKGLKSSATAAVPVMAGDNVTVVGVCQGDAALSVAFVSPLTSAYTTAMSGATSIGVKPVSFQKKLTAEGWESIDTVTSFTVPTTGIYWVAARPVPGTGTTLVDVMNGQERLFTVCAETTTYEKTGKAVSTSAAFHLMTGSTLELKLRSHSRWVTAKTMLSFVHLVGNQQPYAGNHYIAFTGRPASNKDYSSSSNIAFERATTDYGGLYSNKVITIPIGGVYLISLRPDPKYCYPLSLKLHVNSDPEPKWIAYSELSTSGQSVALKFVKGDTLSVRTWGRVESDSLWSVAFVQP